MKRKHLFVLFILFFGFAVRAHAAVVINEVMYDLSGTDTDREWVEVYNDSSTSIDLSTWKFFEANTNHALSPMGGGTVPAGGYAVIAIAPASFESDWPSFSGLLFDSSFSLSNTGETLAIKDSSLNIVDSTTYDPSIGAAGDGNSLQRESDGTWVAALPTPGQANGSSSGNGGDSGGTGDTEQETAVTDTETPSVKADQKIATKIIASPKVVAGLPVDFSNITTGHQGEALFTGKWSWNFGDGTIRENGKNPDKFSHVFSYPGEYTVILEYYESILSEAPIATSKMIITVLSPSIYISNVTYDDKGGIEVTNNSGVDMDLSGWSLVSDHMAYVFSRNTWLISGKKITFSGKTFGLTIISGQPVSLFYPDGTVASVYPKASSVRTYVSRRPLSISPASVKDVTLDNNDQTPLGTAVEGSQASVISSGVWGKSAAFAGFAGVVVGGIFLTRVVRRKKNSTEKSPADEFTIVE